MLTPEQAENIVKMSKSTTFGAETNVRLLLETIEGLAEELSDMMERYDGARDALGDCGSDDYDADSGDDTRLDNEAQMWVDRARRLQTVYKIRVTDGEEKRILRLSHEAASKLAKDLLNYTETCTSVVLDVVTLPEGDE